jgi:hypothetical protein
MAKRNSAPRKQRTRQHVIADLSVHHVEGFILEEGHTAQRLGSDYGYDLLVNTFDKRGYVEPGSIYFQARRPRKGSKSVRIHIPRRQVVDRSAIDRMRELKQEAVREE